MGSKSYPQTVADAWDKAHKVKEERYDVIRGGKSERDAAAGGYAGARERGLDALKDREDEIVRHYADMEGGLKNDALSRGLITSKTYQDVGDLGQQRAGALSLLARQRADLDRQLSGDVLRYMDSRVDQYPNVQAAIDTMRLAGAGGVGYGYGGGQRSLASKFPGLASRTYGYGGLPRGMKLTAEGVPYRDIAARMGGSAGISDAMHARDSSWSRPGVQRTYYHPMNPALAQQGLGPIGYGGGAAIAQGAMAFPGHVMQGHPYGPGATKMGGFPAWQPWPKQRPIFPTQGVQGDQHVG